MEGTKFSAPIVKYLLFFLVLREVKALTTDHQRNLSTLVKWSCLTHPGVVNVTTRIAPPPQPLDLRRVGNGRQIIYPIDWTQNAWLIAGAFVLTPIVTALLTIPAILTLPIILLPVVILLGGISFLSLPSRSQSRIFDRPNGPIVFVINPPGINGGLQAPLQSIQPPVPLPQRQVEVNVPVNFQPRITFTPPQSQSENDSDKVNNSINQTIQLMIPGQSTTSTTSGPNDPRANMPLTISTSSENTTMTSPDDMVLGNTTLAPMEPEDTTTTTTSSSTMANVMPPEMDNTTMAPAMPSMMKNTTMPTPTSSGMNDTTTTMSPSNMTMTTKVSMPMDPSENNSTTTAMVGSVTMIPMTTNSQVLGQTRNPPSNSMTMVIPATHRPLQQLPIYGPPTYGPPKYGPPKYEPIKYGPPKYEPQGQFGYPVNGFNYQVLHHLYSTERPMMSSQTGHSQHYVASSVHYRHPSTSFVNNYKGKPEGTQVMNNYKGQPEINQVMHTVHPNEVTTVGYSHLQQEYPYTTRRHGLTSRKFNTQTNRKQSIRL